MCELGATHMKIGTKTKHKRYDEAFKKSAAEHWLLSGKSARQVASELGFNVQNLPKWKQKFKALPTGHESLRLSSPQTTR
jgi:transposase-like protein